MIVKNYSNMNRFFILLTVLSTLGTGCKTEPNKLILEARLTNIADSTLFSLMSWGSKQILDSTYLIDGHLHLETYLDSYHPEKLLLSAIDFTTKEFIYTNLFVGNEKLSLIADKEDFPWNVDVVGSSDQDVSEDFNQVEFQRQEINSKLKTIHSSNSESLSQRLIEIDDSLDLVAKDLIKKHFNSYAALDYFKYYKTLFSTDELINLYKELDQRLKESDEGKAIKTQSEYLNPRIGDEYYDYASINQDGDSLALSQIEDKYILLHFSSSACLHSQKLFLN